MVIAINLSQDDALPLSELCHSTEKPLLLVKSKGLVGMFRLQAPEHTGKKMLIFLLIEIKKNNGLL
jgi:amyloid beta precursor protein binding protein 1